MEHLCKVVNFDEESVTDYVQIVVGGELENTTELLNSRDAEEKQELQANGKIGVGLKDAFYSKPRASAFAADVSLAFHTCAKMSFKTSKASKSL